MGSQWLTSVAIFPLTTIDQLCWCLTSLFLFPKKAVSEILENLLIGLQFATFNALSSRTTMHLVLSTCLVSGVENAMLNILFL